MENADIQFERRESSYAKNLGLTVYPDSRVVITVPRGSPIDAVDRYLEENTAWITKRLKEMEKYRGCVSLPGGRRDYLKHKETARSFVTARLLMFNQVYGLEYNRVSIKNLRASWGSCSELGNLNYNYKIVHLPEPLAEYIVVHELCHLAEFNHSKRFWALVGRTVPDHPVRRKALLKYLM